MADKDSKKEDKKGKPSARDKAKGAKEAKAAKDPKVAAKKSSKDPKAAKASKDQKAAKSAKDPKAAKSSKDPKAPRTPRDPKAPRTPRDPKAPRTPRDPKTPRTPKDSKASKSPKDSKDSKSKPAKDGKTLKIRKLKGPKKPRKPRNYKKSRELLHKRGRLYAKAIFSGFKRSQRNQYENIALLKIEGAINKEEAKFYVGKRCAYIYKCKNGSYNKHMEKNKIRIIWGKVMRTHGNTGAVRAKFSSNLPAYVMSRRVRIMMYPSNI